MRELMILPTDHVHVDTFDETCSRCRKTIAEGDVPLLAWLPPDGKKMLAYCTACTALTETAVPIQTVEVVCDLCNKDFTNLQDPGGLLLGSKGVGPCCAEKFEKDVRRFGEESYIRARCPEGKPFAEWILELRGEGAGNTIRVMRIPRG